MKFNKRFSSVQRQEHLEDLKAQEKYDLLIIGGGITGAGIARDAAMRGLSVLLVEANDFSSGTSSRSSKLIHGGLRYLENFEFHLVFEALNERQRLYSMAPHLVHPKRFILPLYKNSRVGMFKMSCGMWLYDGLSLFKGPLHERLNIAKTMKRAPILDEKDLVGSFVYSDAYMDDDRLTIETLRSANEAGARCISYCKASSIKMREGKIQSVICEDQLNNKKYEVFADHIVSTVGPWTDQLGESFFDDWKKMLKPSKGIHLTLPKSSLPIDDCVVLSDDVNERIVFTIPRNDMVIVGTTDTAYHDDPSKVSALDDDVKYLVGLINQYFPNIQLQESDILATYAGVRPLVKDDSDSVGKTSRGHTAKTDPRGITFVAGGKYTTYRRMAEEIVDDLLKLLPQATRKKLKPCQTDSVINPYCSPENYKKSFDFVERWSRETSLTRSEVEELVQRHGMESETMLEAYGSDSYWRLEACQAVDNTMCMSLRDFYWRRSHLFLAQKDHGVSILPELADHFAEKLNWSTEKKSQEIQKVHDQIDFELGWQQS